MKCPVCKSENIDKVTGCNGVDGPGYGEWVKYYYCKKCGVMFQPTSDNPTPI